MASFASATLVGHLGRDPETKYTPSGTSVTSFSIATSRKDGQGNEITTWWRCTCFGKRGEVVATYFKKGDPILVQGEPSVREFTKKDGSPGFSAEVIVNDFAFIKGKRDDGDSYNSHAPQPGASSPARPAPAGQPDSAWDDGEDIPF